MRDPHAVSHKHLGHIAAILVAIVLAAFFIRAQSLPERLKRSSPQSASVVLKEIIKNEGAKDAWMTLKEVYAPTGTLIPTVVSVHLLAHTVGSALYQEYGNAGLAMCDDSFTQGCFHGFIDEVIQETGHILPADIADICMNTSSPSGCAHGAGHGVYEATGNTMNALNLCAKLPGKLGPACIEGAFMESPWSLSAAQTEENPWVLCQGLDPIFLRACAVKVGNYFGEAYDRKYTIDYTGPKCQMAPTATMKYLCLGRLGQSALRKFGGDAKRAREACDVLDAPDKYACEFGVADLYRAQYTVQVTQTN